MALRIFQYSITCACALMLVLLHGTFTSIDGADISAMEKNLRDYFSRTRHHDVDQAYKDRAMNFIFDEFERLGLDTEFQNFQEPRVSSTKNFTNVIGILKGEHFGNLTDRIVGVAAHYDTVSTTAGVDDNGAGVVAMLDVARQLTEMYRHGTKRNNTILFVSFDIEEQGLFGSNAFVSQWLPSYFQNNYGPLYASIQPYGFIIMDTMMEFNESAHSQAIPPEVLQAFQQIFATVYSNLQADQFQGDFINVIYRNNSVDSDLASSFDSSWLHSGHPEFEIENMGLPIQNASVMQQNPVFRNFLRSDHTSFWLRDLPAIFLTDSANFRGDMIHCYHQPCDNLEVMLTEDNIRFLGKTADSITKTLDRLSDPFKSPVSAATTAVSSWLLVLCLPFLVAGENLMR